MIFSKESCWVTLLLGVLSLTGCAGTGAGPFKEMQVSQNEGAIYIYSLKTWQGKIQGWGTIAIDGEKLGSWGNGYHYKKLVSPGRHTLEFDATLGLSVTKIPVDVEAGQTYFFKMYRVSLGGRASATMLKLVPRELGLKEIEDTELAT